MNYQFNNNIIIFVIYVLSFYQINCDNQTISSNSSSSKTTLKPVNIGSVDVETQKSGTVKKDEPLLEDVLLKFTSKLDDAEPGAVTKSKIQKRPGVGVPGDVNDTKIQPISENDMILSTGKPIIIKNPIVSSGEVKELANKNVSSVVVKVLNSTITTATTNTTTTTTTTPIPKKPLQTLPSDYISEPPAKPSVTKPVQSSSNTTINNDIKTNSTKSSSSNTSSSSTATPAPSHSVEELEMPKVQFSKEQLPIITSKRDYIIPVVALIFAIPIVLAIATIMYRRAKDYWETRHYRRMDFLIDEMYND